jgi:hypothetical protein
MNDSKTMLFGIPRLEKAPTQEVVRAGWLDNLPVLFKIAIIALVFVVGLAVVFAFSRTGFSSLRYHNDNLYKFMLIPITALQDARVSSINTVRTLEVLDPRNQLDSEAQKGVLEQARDMSIKSIKSLTNTTKTGSPPSVQNSPAHCKTSGR